MVMLDEYLRPIEQEKTRQSEAIVTQHYFILEKYKEDDDEKDEDHDD